MYEAVTEAIGKLQAGDLVEAELREILNALWRDGWDDGAEWQAQEGEL